MYSPQTVSVEAQEPSFYSARLAVELTLDGTLPNALGDSHHRYGTPVHKQISIYGVLDSRPTLLPRVGMS